MREFFRGWKRKAGCVTLLIALAVTGVWIRSHRKWEQIYFPIGQHQYGVWLINGHIYVVRWEIRFGMKRELAWEPEYDKASTTEVEDELAKCTNEDSTFHYQRLHPGMLPLHLILLSAYLILWKPRKRAGPN